MKTSHILLGAAIAATAAFAVGFTVSNGLWSEKSAIAGATDESAAGTAPAKMSGAGELIVDEFHPDHQPGRDGTRPPLPKPAFGGRAIVHIEAMPASLCYAIVNSATARRVLYEVNETLLLRNWETLELEPDLCTHFEVVDTLVLKGGRGADNTNIRIGTFSETSLGFAWISVGSPSVAISDMPKRFSTSEVEAFEKGTVITFHLRKDVHWHDGHPFDARDVLFSWSLYKNKSVGSEEKRHMYEKVVDVQILEPHTIRFFYDHQYFQALSSIGDMCILPSHLYDLSDPENADGNKKRAETPGWKPSDQEEGEYVKKNAHNMGAWVGLGPYKITKWDKDFIEAERNTDYFDTNRAGYLDTIRWRAVKDDNTAFQALLNGELDYLGRVTAEDYFGESTQKPLFTDNFYKGYIYAGSYNYTGWNLRRPKFQDKRVRQALARCFDFEGFKRGFYKGLAEQVTGPWSTLSSEYNRDVKAFPYEPDKAKEMLAEAGWYDRDGDGVIDKDGSPFEVELLSFAGNAAAEAFALKLQEDLARAGIRLKIVALDGSTIAERVANRDFDAVSQAWVLPPESDPEQVWHSKSAAKGSNFAGVMDAHVDELIVRGQRELDVEKRRAIWRELHAVLYDLQPYLFGYNPPKKFAMSRKLRGLELSRVDPNYVIRRWYYPEGTPGTRSTLALPAAGGKPDKQ